MNSATEAQGWPRVCIVGPLPPPSGGMANQCQQLVRLLRDEGALVTHVRTNEPYRPAWVGAVPILRAGFRLLPYLVSLWRSVGASQVAHVFANSGWAWHLLAFPALLVARLRGVPTIVNYRGGQADEFLGAAPSFVLRVLARASMRVTPSAFLRRVFSKYGLDAEIIPNIIDLARFAADVRPRRRDDPHLIVTRNLEKIYDIPTALHAFAKVRQTYPAARLTIAGSGPELTALQLLCEQLQLRDAVDFCGRIDNEHIARLYADADLMLNPSTADNMPISILEALASGVPVVTTAAGGIPDLVEQGKTALLVPVGDADAMADSALLLLSQPDFADRLSQAGIAEVARYSWPRVRTQWQQAYWRVLPVAGI